MTNRSVLVVLTVVIVVTAAVEAIGQGSATQSRELATISEDSSWLENGVPFGTARICYHVAEGCRWENVRGKGSPDVPVLSVPLGIAAASAKLAEAGWEPVGFTPNSPSRHDRLLMKRRKQ